jgi:hypothetical protein
LTLHGAAEGVDSKPVLKFTKLQLKRGMMEISPAMSRTIRSFLNEFFGIHFYF